MAMTDAIMNWRRFLKRRNCSPNTVKNYLNLIKHFVVWVDVPVEEVTHATVARYIEYLMRKRLAPKTVNCHLNGIRQFYHYLREEEGVGIANPIRKNHTQKMSRPLPRHLRDEQVEVFFHAVKSQRDHAMFMLMLRCGLRVEEVAHLTLGVIDVKRRTILIEDGKGAEITGRYGLFGAMGLDISGSLSIGVGIPKDWWEWGGAIGGAAKEAYQAGHKIQIGDYSKAAEHLLPTGVAGPIRAYRERTRGVTSEIGKPVYDTETGRRYMPTTGETALRAMGVRSSRLATTQARLWESKKQAANFQDERNEIYERYRTYLQSDQEARDPQEHKAIRDDVRAFNQRIKGIGLKGQVAEITFASMRRQAKDMQRAPKKIRRMMQ